MAAEYPTPDVIAKDLVNLYRTEFGGKASGKYRLPYRGAQEIFGRLKVRGPVFDEVEAMLNRRGYIITDLGDYFVIISIRYLRNLRPVTKAVWERYNRLQLDIAGA